jgi:hypothetical protein
LSLVFRASLFLPFLFSFLLCCHFERLRPLVGGESLCIDVLKDWMGMFAGFHLHRLHAGLALELWDGQLGYLILYSPLGLNQAASYFLL